jgi:hypothetical protein
MLISQGWKDILLIGVGVLWTFSYLLIIKRGFQDRSLGMPLPSLATNLSWEFIFSFLIPQSTPQVYINIIWLTFDGIILLQAVWFGKKVFADFLSGNWFYLVLLGALVIAFGSILSFTYEFKDWSGKYSAFGSNLMMSILFVAMLFQRKNIDGQSLYIAIFKMLGTLLASINSFLCYPGSILLKFLYVTILIFDGLYIILLYIRCKKLRVGPWTRF